MKKKNEYTLKNGTSIKVDSKYTLRGWSIDDFILIKEICTNQNELKIIAKGIRADGSDDGIMEWENFINY